MNRSSSSSSSSNNDTSRSFIGIDISAKTFDVPTGKAGA